jgi:hypothetical protein
MGGGRMPVALGDCKCERKGVLLAIDSVLPHTVLVTSPPQSGPHSAMETSLRTEKPQGGAHTCFERDVGESFAVLGRTARLVGAESELS